MTFYVPFQGFADILLEAMNDTKLSRMGLGCLPVALLSGLLCEAADPPTKKYIAEKGAVTAYKVCKAAQKGKDVNNDLQYQARHFLSCESQYFTLELHVGHNQFPCPLWYVAVPSLLRNLCIYAAF